MAGWWRRWQEKHQKSPSATSDNQTSSSLLNETPSQLNETPALLKETPALLKERPALLKERPALLKERPALLKETPALLKETPALLNETPALHNNAPAPQPPLPPREIIHDLDSIRQTKDYDLCICHSEEDLPYALDLESYLEEQPEAFRCFLQLRDSAAGGAIPTELCNALANSHCWLLLVTQGFLQDPWCRYQMNQALAEAPMANGRIIPFVKDLEHAQCPKELKYMYNIRATVVKVDGFMRIKTTLLHYFKELCKSERSRSSSTGYTSSSHYRFTTTGQCTQANSSTGGAP